MDKSTRTVMVTGGAGGIGAAICRRFAYAGARIVVADLDLARAENVVSEMKGRSHLAVGIDVGSEASVAAAFDAAESGGESVAVLVACAGGTLTHPGKSGAVVDTSLDDWIATEALNARGSFLCLREYLRRRFRNPVADGRAVLFSSASAQRGSAATGAAYAAAKASVLGLTKQAALEASAHRITVNAVAPGPFDTPALHACNPPAVIEGMRKLVPLGRIGRPEELAALVEFIAGAEAGFITGAVFDINGGVRMA